MKLAGMKSDTINDPCKTQDEARVYNIYLDENLTLENWKLLGEAMREANKLNYEISLMKSVHSSMVMVCSIYQTQSNCRPLKKVSVTKSFKHGLYM